MSIQPPPLPGKKILVVDDDAVVVRALSFKLRGKGYQVLTAIDGSEAVASIRKDRPDLVLLDIHFPPDVGGVSWDGFRVIEWVHHMDEEQRIPVVVITGGKPEEYEQRSEAIGAAAFFHKPINHDELLKTIHKLLEN
jgi:CheY-like chemotaxis protein